MRYNDGSIYDGLWWKSRRHGIGTFVSYNRYLFIICSQRGKNGVSRVFKFEPRKIILKELLPSLAPETVKTGYLQLKYSFSIRRKVEGDGLNCQFSSRMIMAALLRSCYYLDWCSMLFLNIIKSPKLRIGIHWWGNSITTRVGRT